MRFQVLLVVDWLLLAPVMAYSIRMLESWLVRVNLFERGLLVLEMLLLRLLIVSVLVSKSWLLLNLTEVSSINILWLILRGPGKALGTLILLEIIRLVEGVLILLGKLGSSILISKIHSLLVSKIIIGLLVESTLGLTEVGGFLVRVLPLEASLLVDSLLGGLLIVLLVIEGGLVFHRSPFLSLGVLIVGTIKVCDNVIIRRVDLLVEFSRVHSLGRINLQEMFEHVAQQEIDALEFPVEGVDMLLESFGIE